MLTQLSIPAQLTYVSLQRLEDFSEQQHMLQGNNEKGNPDLQCGRGNGENSLTDINEAKTNRTW